MLFRWAFLRLGSVYIQLEKNFRLFKYLVLIQERGRRNRFHATATTGGILNDKTCLIYSCSKTTKFQLDSLDKDDVYVADSDFPLPSSNSFSDYSNPSLQLIQCNSTENKYINFALLHKFFSERLFSVAKNASETVDFQEGERLICHIFCYQDRIMKYFITRNYRFKSLSRLLSVPTYVLSFESTHQEMLLSPLSSSFFTCAFPSSKCLTKNEK